MVLELRPRIDWNKGSAVHWILSVLGLLENNSNGGGGGHTAVPPMQQMQQQQHEGKSASEEAAVAQASLSKSGLSRSESAPAFSLEHTRPQQRLRQDVVAFYLGDDITDEDAFLALKRLSCSSSSSSSTTSTSSSSSGPSSCDSEDAAGEASFADDRSEASSHSSDLSSLNGSVFLDAVASEGPTIAPPPSPLAPLGGVGILVRRDDDGERAAASHASLKLQDTDEVRRFLELVVEAAESADDF